VRSKNIGFEIVRNGTKAFAFVSTRDQLINGMLRLEPESFYLPLQSQESTFNLYIMVIVLQNI